MDLKRLTDEELADHINAALNEQERRQHLAQIPATMAQLATQYRDGGGEQTALLAAITA